MSHPLRPNPDQLERWFWAVLILAGLVLCTLGIVEVVTR